VVILREKNLEDKIMRLEPSLGRLMPSKEARKTLYPFYHART
jgi:hypothetical protein